MIISVIRFFNRIKNVGTSLFMRFFCVLIGVKLGKGIIFKGLASVLKVKSAQIIIGKNTSFNSDNFGYHLTLATKCKLYADKPNSKIIIGENCRVVGACIHAFNEIIIGNRVLIAPNTQIIDGNGHNLCMDNPENRGNTIDDGKPIKIEDDVWIGVNSMVLGGVTIGKGSIISANTLVNRDVPPYSLVGENPMRVLKNYR